MYKMFASTLPTVEEVKKCLAGNAWVRDQCITPTIDIPYMDAYSAVDELRDNKGINDHPVFDSAAQCYFYVYIDDEIVSAASLWSDDE